MSKYLDHNLLNEFQIISRTITDDYERLSIEKQEILLFLLDNNRVKRSEAAKLIGYKRSKTFDILSEMVEERLIQRNGKGRETYYTILKGIIEK